MQGKRSEVDKEIQLVLRNNNTNLPESIFLTLPSLFTINYLG
jgi:hypothetical protein